MSEKVRSEINSLKLSPEVIQKLGQVRQMLRKYICIQSLFSALCWALFIFWIGGLFDFLPVRAGSSESPRWLRIIFLCLMAGGCAWILLGWALPRIFRRIRNRSVALLIEKHYTQFNNGLVTAVELSDGREFEDEVSNPTAYQSMLERVHESLDQNITQVDVKNLFNWQPIWARGTLAVLAIVITASACLGMPQWMGIWSNRLFTLSDQPWPRQANLRDTGVQLQLPAFSRQLASERTLLPFNDGKVRVPVGAPAVLLVAAEAENKVVPEVCTMFYASKDGDRGRANFRRLGSVEEGWQEFALDGPPLDGISSSMEIDVIGLDASLRDLTIETVAPVVITDLKIRCLYPRYLLQSVTRPAEELLSYQTGIRIPQGTQISLVGTTSRPIQRVDYFLHNNEVAQNEDLSVASQIIRQDTEGQQFEITLGTLAETQVIELRVIDEFGLSSESIPRYVLTMLEDSIPEVTARLNGIGSSITKNATLPIEGTVTDDNGIAGTYIELIRGEQKSTVIPVQLNSGDELETTVDLKTLAEQGRFTPQLDETIGLVVEARDHFDLSESEHAGQSQPIQLTVVSPDDLLVILDREELGLRQRLEQIIYELTQLQEVANYLAADTLPVAQIPLLQTVKERPPFRLEQIGQQADKSKQELKSLVDRVENIMLQLRNNRLDSIDRQLRLKEKVIVRLNYVVDFYFLKLVRGTSLAKAANEERKFAKNIFDIVTVLESIVSELENVKNNMLDIESFNEIIDLVRGILEEQDELLKETEKANNAKILDFLQ